jgi:hypothetical protein
MSLTNPPPAVNALASMLALCPSWVGGTGTMWYPVADPATTGTLAVISPEDETRSIWAEGAVPIPSGQLIISIHADDTIGNVETLAQTLQKELLTLTTGLKLRSARTGRCAIAGPARTAGGEPRAEAHIFVDYGISA